MNCKPLSRRVTNSRTAQTYSRLGRRCNVRLCGVKPKPLNAGTDETSGCYRRRDRNLCGATNRRSLSSGWQKAGAVVLSTTTGNEAGARRSTSVWKTKDAAGRLPALRTVFRSKSKGADGESRYTRGARKQPVAANQKHSSSVKREWPTPVNRDRPTCSDCKMSTVRSKECAPKPIVRPRPGVTPLRRDTLDVSACRIGGPGVRRDSAPDSEPNVSRSSRGRVRCTGAPPPPPPPPSPRPSPKARRFGPPSQPPSPPPSPSSQPPSPPPSSNGNDFRRDGHRTGTFTVTGSFAFNFGGVAPGMQRPERTSVADSSYEESVREYLNNPMYEGMVAPRRLAVPGCSFKYIDEDDPAGYDTPVNWRRMMVDRSSLGSIPVDDRPSDQ